MSQEFELLETEYVRDIDNRVFQRIALQCLNKIEGISLAEGKFIKSILSKISAVQDNENHSVNIKVEVNICYGESIPQKSEEIQTKITEAISQTTGLHVSRVHVVVKNMISPEKQHQLVQRQKEILESSELAEKE